MRIVVLGGGLGGVATVRHLERVLRRRRHVEITLVSRENFFVLTPLLFEACSGNMELRHCAQPIRAAIRRSRFIEAQRNPLTSTDSSFELSVADIAALGVRRISVGPALALAAWTGFRCTAELLKSEGSFAGFAKLVPYPEINGFFTTDYRAR